MPASTHPRWSVSPGRRGSAFGAWLIILGQYEFRFAGKPHVDEVFADLVIDLGLSFAEFDLEGKGVILVIHPFGWHLALHPGIGGGTDMHGVSGFFMR